MLRRSSSSSHSSSKPSTSLSVPPALGVAPVVAPVAPASEWSGTQLLVGGARHEDRTRVLRRDWRLEWILKTAPPQHTGLLLAAVQRIGVAAEVDLCALLRRAREERAEAVGDMKLPANSGACCRRRAPTAVPPPRWAAFEAVATYIRPRYVAVVTRTGPPSPSRGAWRYCWC